MAALTSSQFVVGTLGPILTAELQISRAELGGLTTVAFAVGGLW